MSWIAGIDYSTHAIDVVLIDENDELAPEWHRYPLEGGDAFDRARLVRDTLNADSFDHWKWHTLALGIEDPRGQNAGALYRIQGAILANLPSRLLVQPWIPSQWRKAVGLPGNASKADIYAAVMGEEGSTAYASWPQDACDAYCIALATKHAITREETA